MEILASTYSQLYQLNISVLRFFTVYGPYGRPDMAPYIFTDSIVKGKPIQIFNHGNQKRDFTYIEDIVDGCVKVIDCKNQGYQVYNLGSGKPVNLMSFVSTIENLVGKKADTIMVEAQLGDVFETEADISRAKKELGYSPSTSIEDGLREYVDWFLRFYNI
jgi:UDP-glucuronate 4-epimerase